MGSYRRHGTLPARHSVLLPGGSPEDGYVVVYVGWASLGHALGYPDHVACLLFTQTHVRVEHAHVELADESQLHQLTLHTHTQGICRQQISTPGPVFPPLSHLNYMRLEDGYVGVGVHNPNGTSIGSSAFVRLYGQEDHATSVTTCRILYQRHPRLTQVVLEKKLLKLSWKGDTLSTFKRHLKFHLFQSAFTVQSSCASDSDSFSRFLAPYKLVCMYVYV